MKPLLLIWVFLLLNGCEQSQAQGRPCVLVAGAGCGTLVLEKTRRSDFLPDAGTEKRFANEGVTFTFDANDTLDSIVVVGNKRYKTDKGVSPGDKEERVLQAYGKPTKTGKMVLYKRENEPIGAVGDQALMYPGILFMSAAPELSLPRLKLAGCRIFSVVRRRFGFDLTLLTLKVRSSS